MSESDNSVFVEDDERKPAAKVTQTNLKFFFTPVHGHLAKRPKLAPIDNAGRRQCTVCGKRFPPRALSIEAACLVAHHGVRNMTRAAPSGGVKKRGPRKEPKVPSDDESECKILDIEFPSEDNDNTSDEDYEFTDLTTGEHSHGDEIDSDVDSDDLHVKVKAARYPK
jgi:hypothetical protein